VVTAIKLDQRSDMRLPGARLAMFLSPTHMGEQARALQPPAQGLMNDTVPFIALDALGEQSWTVIGVLSTVQGEYLLRYLRTEAKVRRTTTCTMEQSGIAVGNEARLHPIKLSHANLQVSGGLFSGEKLPKVLLKNTDALSFFCAHSQGSCHLRGSCVMDTSRRRIYPDIFTEALHAVIKSYRSIAFLKKYLHIATVFTDNNKAKETEMAGECSGPGVLCCGIGRIRHVRLSESGEGRSGEYSTLIPVLPSIPCFCCFKKQQTARRRRHAAGGTHFFQTFSLQTYHTQRVRSCYRN
jgi:hypothetical protein